MNARPVLLRTTAAVAAFVALTAFALVTPKNAELVYKQGGYSATLPEGWQFNTYSGVLSMTRLGDSLQTINVFRRKHAHAFDEIKVETKPDTGVEELSEFFVAGLKKVNKNVEILQTVPETIAGKDAARIDWRMVTESGVPYRASTFVFVTKSYIVEVQYKATEQVYWDMDHATFETFVASLKMLPEKGEDE